MSCWLCDHRLDASRQNSMLVHQDLTNCSYRKHLDLVASTELYSGAGLWHLMDEVTFPEFSWLSSKLCCVFVVVHYQFHNDCLHFSPWAVLHIWVCWEYDHRTRCQDIRTQAWRSSLYHSQRKSLSALMSTCSIWTAHAAPDLPTLSANQLLLRILSIREGTCWSQRLRFSSPCHCLRNRLPSHFLQDRRGEVCHTSWLLLPIS